MISRRSCTQLLHIHHRWWIRRLMAISPSFSPDSLLFSNSGIHLLSCANFSSSASIAKYSPAVRLWGSYTCRAANNNNNNNKYLNGFQPAQALAPSLPVFIHAAEDLRFDKLDEIKNETSTRATKPPSEPDNDDKDKDKIVVAVDVDEVLGNFVSALNEFIADRYSSYHSVSEYHVYEFFKIWKCSKDEADIRVHEFFKTSYFKTGIRPIPGARQSLQKLSRFCNLSIVTSRQNAIKDHTIEWIERHYPGLFHDIHFGNHFALNGKSIPKSDICRSLGANVLIDDNPRYAIECAEAGIKVLLFDYENSYPWSKSESLNGHPMVKKVHNWGEVEHQLTSWIFPRKFTPK